MEKEFSFDVDENTINELKKAIGYDEIEARHKRFMEGKETVDDLINHIYHYEIKNDKGLDLDVVELKYYKKLVKIINLMAEHLVDIIDNDDNASLLPFYNYEEDLKYKVLEYFTNKVEEDK